MLVPLSWLREFASFDLEPVDLGEVFDDLGMVVEGLKRVGEGLEGVDVARVVSIEAIAGADRIRKVIVDVGGPSSVQVVCGAWNFEVGDVVALARVGATLPGDLAIFQRKMKGVVSDGMLCSARELDMGDEADGIMVLGEAVLGEAGRSIAPGTPLREALGIESDVVYDLAIEGNRPDAMCMAGVARDAAARLRLAFSMPHPSIAPAPAPGPAVALGPPAVSVRVEDVELCRRFTATVISGVTVGDSPTWLARRLTLAGMRPINSVVDASNYVMLELGQPTHPYDLALLSGGGFVVRAARPAEQIETLDGLVRTLGEGDYPDCLICDATDTAVGVAGVMGGTTSEISAGTSHVVLEAANFNPIAIARTSKRLGLRSEASHRFERGVDIEGIDRAVARFCELLALTSPSLAIDGESVDVRAPSTIVPRAPIRLRMSRANAILGTSLTADMVISYLTPIGFVADPLEPDVLAVDVPTFRPDATSEIDIIEEVARHHGYSNIERTVPSSPYVGRLSQFQAERRQVRSVLAGAGLSEAVCSQLLGPGDHGRAGLAEDAIAAIEPLAREESLLRTSLLPGMLRTVAFNTDRRRGDLAMFEIGHTFRGTHGSGPGSALAELPDEHEMLGIALAGRGVEGVGSGGPGALTTLRRLGGALRLAGLDFVATSARPGMHPSRTADILIDGAVGGYVGEVDPDVSAEWGIADRVGWVEVDLGIVLGADRKGELTTPVSRFPSSDIDLAFVVPDDVPAAAVETTLTKTAGSLLERLALFDVYRGTGAPDGSRSLAYRLRFCAQDRTLTDSEVGALRASCIEAVESNHRARLRS